MKSSTGEIDILEKANKEFEYVWSNVFGLIEENHLDPQIQLCARRLLSYNPQHRAIEEKMPQLYNAVNTLCSVISARIKELSQSENVQIWIILLYCYLLMNDMPNAYTAAAHAFRLQPEIPDPYFNYCVGLVYQHFHYNEDAIKFYKRPSDNFEQNIDRNFRLAVAYRACLKYPESESLFRNLLKHPPPNLKQNDIKLQLAYTLQLSRRTVEAAKIYEELLSQKPQCHELIQQYVWFLSTQDDEKLLLRASDLIGDSTDAILKLAQGTISMKLHHYKTAYQHYRECTGTWSNTPLFWCGLGILYFANDQLSDSIHAFQRALFLESNIPEAWLNLGLIYEIRKENENAMKVYQTALSNCRNKSLISQRIADCERPQRQVMSKEFLENDFIHEIGGRHLFAQPMDTYSEMLISFPPILSEACFNKDKSVQPQLQYLVQPYPSLFD